MQIFPVMSLTSWFSTSKMNLAIRDDSNALNLNRKAMKQVQLLAGDLRKGHMTSLDTKTFTSITLDIKILM